MVEILFATELDDLFCNVGGVVSGSTKFSA